MKCKATRKDGEPCRAEAIPGADYCNFHDPKRAEAFQKGREKGGRSPKLPALAEAQRPATLATVKPWRGQPGEVEVLRSVQPVELVNLLCQTIDDVLTGCIDPKVANAVGYLVGAITKVQQLEALDERLSAIEEALSLKGKGL